jgi:hypothetical protein
MPSATLAQVFINQELMYLTKKKGIKGYKLDRIFGLYLFIVVCLKTMSVTVLNGRMTAINHFESLIKGTILPSERRD